MSKRTHVSVTPVLWSRKDKDNLHPIKIRVTKNRKSKYITVGYSIRKSEWSQYKRCVKTNHPEFEKINYEISQMVSKVEGSETTKVSGVQVGSNLVEYIKLLIEQKRGGNKYYSTKRYNTLLQHLVSFWGHETIHFYDIDSNIISEFRLYLETNIKPKGLDKEPSPNTVNNYLKVLRSVFNRSIKDSVFFGESPFKDGHIPQKVRTPKITLDRNDIWFLDNLTEDRENMTRRMWDSINVFLFCFWSQGIRIGDCLQLKYGNLVDGIFEITIDKTERKHRFPLTRNNLFRILFYIDGLPDFFSWEKGKYYSTNMVEGEDDNFIGFGELPYPLTPEVEMVGAYTRLIQDRITLYENLEKSLTKYNRSRHINNRVDLYVDDKYNLYDRDYFHLVQNSNNSMDNHWFNLYHESKDLFLRLGMKYLVQYSNRKENQNKFIFPFLRGLENEVGVRRWNKISSSTTIVNKNLKKISQRYGIRHFSSHYSRHTFTSLSKDMGVDIYDLKNWLGHTSIRTTEGYINSVDSSGVLRHNEKLNDFFKR